MDRLRKLVGKTSGDHVGRRALTQAELFALMGGGLIMFGSHLHSHTMSASLAAEKQRFEICYSKKTLEKIVGRPVTGFSYPNGSASEVRRNIVKDAGFV